jgi:putative membrane protein
MTAMIRRTAAAFAVALLAAGTVWGQASSPGATGQSKQNSAPHADSSFMKDAAESGMAEVEASKIAVNKAVNTQIKSFAQQMIDDHTKANDELKALAASKNVKLPTEPSMVDRAKIKMLDGADGANFDRRYADSFGVSAHQKTVKLFEKQAKNGKDAEVKAWAEKTLPTLQHHLQMAQDIKLTAAKEGNAKAPGDRKQ